MKDRAEEYDVDGGRAVVGGGSSGENIALLAAHPPRHSQLTPEDVEGTGIKMILGFDLAGTTLSCHFHDPSSIRNLRPFAHTVQ